MLDGHGNVSQFRLGEVDAQVLRCRDPLLGTGAPADAKAFGCISTPSGGVPGVLGAFLLLGAALWLRRRA